MDIGTYPRATDDGEDATDPLRALAHALEAKMPGAHAHRYDLGRQTDPVIGDPHPEAPPVIFHADGHEAAAGVVIRVANRLFSASVFSCSVFNATACSSFSFVVAAV